MRYMVDVSWGSDPKIQLERIAEKAEQGVMLPGGDDIFHAPPLREVVPSPLRSSPADREALRPKPGR